MVTCNWKHLTLLLMVNYVIVKLFKPLTELTVTVLTFYVLTPYANLKLATT